MAGVVGGSVARGATGGEVRTTVGVGVKRASAVAVSKRKSDVPRGSGVTVWVGAGSPDWVVAGAVVLTGAVVVGAGA